MALSFDNLAIACKLHDKYAEAGPLYPHALKLQEKFLGERHPDVARSPNNLANLHREKSH